MTDNEIIKALECCINPNGANCKECPYDICCTVVESIMLTDVLNLINRQKAEIEELTYKLECLLCHATGGRLSKSTYTLKTMETVVTDYVQESYDEAQSEAIKEFAERLKFEFDDFYYSNEDALLETADLIDDLVKEMTEAGNGKRRD